MPPRSGRSIVFISHSSHDRQLADGLYRAFTRPGGLECWMDNYDLSPEEGAFPEQIVAALQKSGALALVDTPAARGSDYVQREIQTAGDLQIPVLRCRLDPALPAWRLRLAYAWLRLRLLFQLRRRFLAASGLLSFLLLALAGGLFYFGTQVAPVLARADLRDLPAAFRPTPTPTATLDPALPQVAAPFHFLPAELIYDASFTDPSYENRLDEQKLTFNLQANLDLVTAAQRQGVLDIRFPSDCLDPKRYSDCRIELVSQPIPEKGVEYFGARARLLSGNTLRGITLGLASIMPDENLVGYGWYFTDQAMAFLHSPPKLPERDFTTLVQIDSDWHAYEVLRDPQNFTWYFYVDGQLVGSTTPQNGPAWDSADFQVTLYSARNKLNDPSGSQNTETIFEINRILVGSF